MKVWCDVLLWSWKLAVSTIWSDDNKGLTQREWCIAVCTFEVSIGHVEISPDCLSNAPIVSESESSHQKFPSKYNYRSKILYVIIRRCQPYICMYGTDSKALLISNNNIVWQLNYVKVQRYDMFVHHNNWLDDGISWQQLCNTTRELPKLQEITSTKCIFWIFTTSIFTRSTFCWHCWELITTYITRRGSMMSSIKLYLGNDDFLYEKGVWTS